MIIARCPGSTWSQHHQHHHPHHERDLHDQHSSWSSSSPSSPPYSVPEKKHHRHRSHQYQRPHHHRYHRCKSKGSARIKAWWLKGAHDEPLCRQRQRIVNFCLESRSSDTVNRNNRFKRAAASLATAVVTVAGWDTHINAMSSSSL